MPQLYALCWYFFLYAFLGWCAEVAFAACKTGRLVNRGFLNGPVCPIYGFGMLAAVTALGPVRGSLPALFFGGGLLATALELVGGWALMTLFHARWWDYSDKPFNLGGYICLRFSLLWGLGVTAVMRLVHPAVELLVSRLLTNPPGAILLGVCAGLFAADLIATVITVTGLMRQLGELERLTALLQKSSDLLTRQVGGAALAADERISAGREKLEGRTGAARAELEMRRDLLRAEILDRQLGAQRLLRAFPTLKSTRYEAALRMLRQELGERLRRR